MVVFFKQKTAYEMRISDWSSDVCSSDLDWFASGLSPSPPYPDGGGAKRNRRPDMAVSPFLVPRSEEHTSELQSLMRISYAVFCLKKKNTTSKQQKPSATTTHKKRPQSISTEHSPYSTTHKATKKQINTD